MTLNFFPGRGGGACHQMLKKCWGSPNFDRPWEYIGGVHLVMFCILKLTGKKEVRSFLKSFYLVLLKVYFGKKVNFTQCFLRYISEKGPFHPVLFKVYFESLFYPVLFKVHFEKI